LIGLAVAGFLGYLIYRGGTRIDIRAFFRVTGVLIVLFAAGLVAKGIHEFQEVGLLPALVDPLWDLNIFEPDTSLIGQFGKSLFGWRPDPSLLMVIGYLAYLVPIGGAFLSMTKAKRPVPST
jgi:high-affinity iron transporter